MLPRRLSVLMLTAAGLALIAGCTHDTPHDPASAPVVVTTATTGAGTQTTTPAVPSLPPTQFDPSTPPVGAPSSTPGRPPVTNADPDLKAVKGCPGCTVRQIRRAVRPGISVALLVGKATPFDRGVLVSFRSSTGTVISQLAAAGDSFRDQDGKPSTVACDISFHCLLPAGIGAHSAVMTVASVSRAGVLDLVTDKIAVNSLRLRALDLDGDGIDEIVGVLNDCEPNCADGHDSWVAYKLAGRGYIQIGCAPYDRKARPPARLTPEACPK